MHTFCRLLLGILLSGDAWTGLSVAMACPAPSSSRADRSMGHACIPATGRACKAPAFSILANIAAIKEPASWPASIALRIPLNARISPPTSTFIWISSRRHQALPHELAADHAGSWRGCTQCQKNQLANCQPESIITAGGSSAKEAKQALAGAAAKHIREARPHRRQCHKVHHGQPQEEGCPHKNLGGRHS